MSSHLNPRTETRLRRIVGLEFQKAIVSVPRSHSHTVSNENSRSSSDGSSSARPRVSGLMLVLPLLIFATGFAAFWPALRPEGQTSPAIGKPAPQIDLVMLADQTGLNQFRSLPDGKVVLLHFWGTWCPPCKMEYPELSEMANQLASKSNFQFVPVSCEASTNETFEGLRTKTEDYFASASITSVSYCDPQGATRLSTAERLDRNLMFYPTSLVIGTDGRIAGVWEGYAPDAIEEMREIIGQLTASE